MFAGSNGTAVLDDASTGAFTYTPNANFFGTETIQWKVSDQYCESIIYNFVITVNAVDDAPVWTSTDPVTANTYNDSQNTTTTSLVNRDGVASDLGKGRSGSTTTTSK